MALSIDVELKLEIVTCCVCNTMFGLQDAQYTRLRKTRNMFYCPSGHAQSFTGKNVEDELRRQLKHRDEDLRWYHAHAQDLEATIKQERRAHGATKGQLTKTKKRIAGGVCPCCHRTFQQLARHMANQHPGYDIEDHHG